MDKVNEITKDQVGIFTVCHGTAEQWEINNPLLAKGEIGYSSSNNRIKIGDGIKRWNDLEYVNSKFDYGDINAENISVTTPDFTAKNVQAALLELLNSLNLHKGDNKNPHNVTAEQLGAALDVDVKSNTKAIANNATAISNNASNILKNSESIATNSTNIASNLSKININTTNIAANQTAINTIKKDYVPKTQLASTTKAGIVQMATDTEALAGTEETKYINAKQLREAVLTLGSYMDYKGNVATFSDLPKDNKIGDVWFVIDESVGYIWLDVNGVEKWEEFGKPIDLSGYYTKEELDPIDLGAVTENDPFPVTEDNIKKVFGDRPVAIQFTFNGLLVNLYRLVRTTTSVFYPAQIMLDGLTYNYSVRIDKDTNPKVPGQHFGYLFRNVEDIIVDGGDQSLTDGLVFDIKTKMNPTNVVFYRVKDTNLGRTRFFVKTSLETDAMSNITKVVFIDKQDTLEGKLVLDVASKKCAYTVEPVANTKVESYIQVGTNSNFNSPTDELEIGGIFFEELGWKQPITFTDNGTGDLTVDSLPEAITDSGDGDLVLNDKGLTVTDDGNGNITIE